MKMEGGARSAGVLKKKSSSGCLIVKKKGGDKNSGGRLGNFNDDNTIKEKKRARLVEQSSDSSDEEESLEFMRRKANDKRFHNGSMEYRRSELGNREFDSHNAGIENSGERKRSRLDLYEFDEYDEFDGYLESRFKKTGRSGNGSMKEFGVSSSNRNVVVDKRKKGSYFDGSSSGWNKGLESEDDEAQMPISLLRSKNREHADLPSRMQGKNGVLKVMVNKKKRMDSPSQPRVYDDKDVKERKGSSSADRVKKDLLARSAKYPATKPLKNQGLYVDKDKKERNSEKVKSSLNKGNKAKDSEVDDTDMMFKLGSSGVKFYSSKKGMKKEEERSPALENFTPIKGNEGKEVKAKRGGSTEKQMLREKIREMLINAGWTIDYRPRRNRDYLDAVYINPSGTAYWSIIKAYDAFKKQLGEDNGKSEADVASSFAPLSEDLINKLTRQTRKKIEAKSAKRSAVRQTADSSDSDQSEEQISSHMKQNKSRSGKMGKMEHESDDDSDEELPKRRPGKVRIEKSSGSKFNIIQGRTSKVFGRCTLLVRGFDKGENSDSDGYVPYRGKRTVLAWLIDSGAAKLSEKVQYMNRRRNRVMLEGWITRDGIHCGCCSKILTVSKFELHAGSKLRQPFQNIFLESGSSLLQCQIDAWNSQEESERRDFCTVEVDGDDPDDDTCGICGDGGDLICCDSCPSTFHQICIGIQILPKGDWHCPNCTCKFCGCASENVADGKDISRCNFCEKKYHRTCRDGVDALPMNSNDASFCGLKCQEIYDHLQKILGVKHELEAGYSWSLIQQTDVTDTLQRGFPQRVECNSKLAVALSVMDECFLPIIDRRSGINIIHNVVYNCGSNFNRLNYRRFYTVILERGDEIIAAASIRLHGDFLAEMPFIGTREIYRRQGMCRRLLSAIETELRSLKVRKLIIPAISEHMNTWTTVFGFSELNDVLKKEIKSLNMLVFPGTDMLQKQMARQENLDGAKISESTKHEPVLVKKSEIDSPLEQNRQASTNSMGHEESKSSDAVDASEHGSPETSIPTTDNTGPCGDAKPDDNISGAPLMCSPTPAEDKINSIAKAVVGNKCKNGTQESTQTHASEFTGIQANIGSMTNASEGGDINNTASVPVMSSLRNTDKVNGDSCPETIVSEDTSTMVEEPVPDALPTDSGIINDDQNPTETNGPHGTSCDASSQNTTMAETE